MAFFVSQETGMQKARRLAQPRIFNGLSTDMQAHVRRIMNTTILPPHFVAILEAEEASFHICRWVAWGKKSQDRAIRLALAILLRRECNPLAPARSASGWAWPKDHLCSAGEKMFRTLPQYGRLVRGGVIAAVGSIPNPTTFTIMWARSWPALQAEVATIDGDMFRQQVDQAAKTRKRRQPSRRRVIKPEEQAVIDAVSLIAHGVARGTIRVDDRAVQALTRTKTTTAKETTT